MINYNQYNHTSLSMITKLFLTFGILIYAIGVPILEINSTHVFNTDWTPHVRIHEVWQLITNSSIGVFSLWLVWYKQKIIFPCILGILITGGFLLAFILQDFYGGSMKYLDGSEKTLIGINIGVLGFGIVFIIFFHTLFLKNYRK